MGDHPPEINLESWLVSAGRGSEPGAPRGVNDGKTGRDPRQNHLPPSLRRLSVGIEHAEDLWADLDSALRAVGP